MTLPSMFNQYTGGADRLNKSLAHETSVPPRKRARHYRDIVVHAMAALRDTGDQLELMIPHETWPLATYREMLFIK